MGATIGLDAKLYYLATGTRATWGEAIDGVHVGAAPGGLTEVTSVRDLTIPMEDDEADVMTRGNNRWEAVVATVRKASIDIPMVYDNADPAFQALMKAFLTRGEIGLAFLDGDKATAGTQGLWMTCIIKKAEKGEEMTNAQMMTFTARPAYAAVGPEWVEVGGA